ncbi:MAG: response regulator [Rhodoferax sp.]|nr:response regulator [Rhodoferax sp.]
MESTDVKGARILIVDDASSVRSLLNNVLAAHGYVVVGQLASGKDLLETVARCRPDLVCLDYNLPGSDGMGLLQSLHKAHPDVSIVMITGNNDPDIEERAADAGAQGFIHKPFSLTKLTQDLEQVVRARKLLKGIHKPESDAVPQTQTAVATAVIADDSATMRYLLSSILVSTGIRVVGLASDGKQAADAVQAHSPDLVCLDWNMPVLSGLDALRLIRASRPATKVLMISGRADREAIISANHSGAKGYILKPFDPEKVISTVKKLIPL